MRRVALKLAPDTTASECGSCPHLFEDSSERFDCSVFRVDLDFRNVGVGGVGLRHQKCIDAEIPTPAPVPTVVNATEPMNDTERPPPNSRAA